jgi:DNA invertase Pin-like site-specific DNA recombinase
MIDHQTTVETKCVIYARFSPRPNQDECDSCDYQLAELRSYAAARGWEIVAEFRDDAVSGKTDYESRPGLFDAAQACKRGYVLLVHRIDRLFRDLQHGLAFRAMLVHKKIKLQSIHEDAACVDSPEGRMMLSLFLIFAQYQRELTSARTRSKMLMYQAQGRRMSRLPPYGSRLDPYDKKRLVPEVGEQQNLEMLKQLRAQGLSPNKIADMMNARHIPCRAAKQWTHTQVRRIFRHHGIK